MTMLKKMFIVLLLSSAALAGTTPTAPLPPTKGGTGVASLTANNVVLGGGTGPVTFVAPCTSGYVLTSNGTTWTCQASSSGGNVVISSTSGEKIARARITNGGSCAISSQSGSWISSISHPAAGKCTLTFAASTFSAAPSCVVTYTSFGGIIGFPLRLCALDSASTSSAVTVACGYDNSGSTVANDQDFDIICMGPS
jgi:hypothetical protein